MNTGVILTAVVVGGAATIVAAYLLMQRRNRGTAVQDRTEDVWAAGLVNERSAPAAQRKVKDRRELWARRYGAGSAWGTAGVGGAYYANYDGVAPIDDGGAGDVHGATGCGGGAGCGGGGCGGGGGGCGGS
ncbi:hypothetical protein AB0K11_27520 [Mycobacterium sp. NPDC050551]|uniref:hypothetical protein n=1 Tax=Mycobacterium sp. NPDC050551 TaxID=3155407 RepID=UPI0034313DA2